MMNTFEYKFSELGLDEHSIGRLLWEREGYPHSEFAGLIGELLDTASRECQAKAEFRIFPVDEWNPGGKSVTLDGVVFVLKNIVFRQLSLAESIAIFLCTAGYGPERLGKKAMGEGDPLAYYVYDIIGSEIAERTSRMVMQEVSKTAEKWGYKTTNRYSPGYCGWDVSDQHALFGLMPDNFCGISLNDSALMSPEKSVSGMIGIGRNVHFDPYPCNSCRRQDCLYRKTH